MGQHYAIPPEMDVLMTQGHGEPWFRGIGVFTNAKQEKECKHNEGRTSPESGVWRPAKMCGEPQDG